MDLLAFDIIADDKSLITYRPKLRKLTGSVTAAILLSQIMYWSKKSKYQPFYKYKLRPAKDDNDNYPDKYREGDSWCEELQFSKSEFETALKKIGKKVKKGQAKPQDCFVWYWTTISRVTYYQINFKYLSSKLIDLYKSENDSYINTESVFTKEANQYLDYTENTAKNTTKNITDILGKKNNSDLDNDFIDFRELIKQSKKIGNLGHAKAILQTELNLLTFSTHESKQLKDLLYKIKGDLRAYNKLNKIEDNVNDEQIIKAFQTSVKHFKETTDSTKYSISYLKSCINPNVFLQAENNNLNDYKQIVKETFKHYKTLNRSEVATLENIKKQIGSYLGTENDQAILSEFKKIFDNLPDYIMEKRSYQSIGYIKSKLTDLLLQTDYKNDSQYIYLEQLYGAKKAQTIYNKKYKITN